MLDYVICDIHSRNPHYLFHSLNNKPLLQENYVWSCSDVTGWCEVSVSSRQGMAGALTDGSTETFWESGDEDRNKAKWVQVALPAPAPAPPARPHLVALHVDNTRDTVVTHTLHIQIIAKSIRKTLS